MRVTNITEEPVVLAHYRLLNGLGAVVRPQLADDVQGTVDTWLAELSAEHGAELFAGEIVAPPGEPITRWFIGSAYAPLPDGVVSSHSQGLSARPAPRGLAPHPLSHLMRRPTS